MERGDELVITTLMTRYIWMAARHLVRLGTFLVMEMLLETEALPGYSNVLTPELPNYK